MARRIKTLKSLQLEYPPGGFGGGSPPTKTFKNTDNTDNIDNTDNTDNIPLFLYSSSLEENNNEKVEPECKD